MLFRSNKNGNSFYKNFIWGMSNTGKVYAVSGLSSSGPGYNAGFYLNPNVFRTLGYSPSNVSAQVLISDSPTVDSFLISQSGLGVGVLENFTNFNYITNDFSQINLTNGSNAFYLYDTEIINAILVPITYK